MSTHDDLDRLAEARPAILHDTYLVMDAAQEERLLTQILHSPGPAARKSRRPRARRPHRSATIAAVAAAVTGVAVAATLVAASIGHPGAPGPAAGSPGHRGTPVIKAEMLAQRTTLAVSAARKDIEYTQVTYAAGTAGITGQVSTLQLWTYGPLTQESTTAADGSPDMRMSGVVADGTRYRRFIDYASRTWQEDSIPVAQFGQLPANWITTKVRQMINGPIGPAQKQHNPYAESPIVREGTLPDGERVVMATSQAWTYEGANGAPAVGGPPVSPALPLPELADPEFIPPQAGPALTVHTTVVIDASTYLPLRVTITATDGRVIESQSFSWLPPTAANLAPLQTQVPVPAGFAQTG